MEFARFSERSLTKIFYLGTLGDPVPCASDLHLSLLLGRQKTQPRVLSRLDPEQFGAKSTDNRHTEDDQWWVIIDSETH